MILRRRGFKFQTLVCVSAYILPLEAGLWRSSGSKSSRTNDPDVCRHLSWGTHWGGRTLRKGMFLYSKKLQNTLLGTLPPSRAYCKTCWEPFLEACFCVPPMQSTTARDVGCSISMYKADRAPKAVTMNLAQGNDGPSKCWIPWPVSGMAWGAGFSRKGFYWL